MPAPLVPKARCQENDELLACCLGIAGAHAPLGLPRHLRRHADTRWRVGRSIMRAARRQHTRVTRKPGFLLNTNPACYAERSRSLRELGPRRAAQYFLLPTVRSCANSPACSSIGAAKRQGGVRCVREGQRGGLHALHLPKARNEMLQMVPTPQNMSM